MAVNLSPIWGAGAQLLDNSGNVLSGGKIYTYAAGTTTQVTTYTSNTGVTANSNPIVLNSAGRVPYEIWLTDGQNYKFVLKDSNDVLIGTWDNLSGINSNFIAYTNQQEIQTATAGQTVFNLTTMNYLPGTNSLSVFVDGVNQYGPGAQYAFEETDSNTVTFASGLHVGAEVKFTSSQIQNAGAVDASQVGYVPPYTDSVPTNVEAKLAQYVSVKDFGAVGDGALSDYSGTDNSAALQAAINYALTKTNTKGITLFIPAGIYCFDTQLDIIYQGASYIRIVGDYQGSTLVYRGTNKAMNFTTTSFDGSYNQLNSRITLENFTVYGKKGFGGIYDNCIGLSFIECAEIVVTNVESHYFDLAWNIIDTPGFRAQNPQGINSRIGFNLKKTSTTVNSDLSVINFYSPTGSGNACDLYIDGVRDISIFGGILASTNGVELRGVSNQIEAVRFFGTFFDYTDYTTPTIAIGNAADTNQIVEVSFFDCYFATHSSFTKYIISAANPYLSCINVVNGFCSEIVPNFILLAPTCYKQARVNITWVGQQDAMEYRVTDTREDKRTTLFDFPSSLQSNADMLYFPDGYLPFGYSFGTPASVSRYTAAYVTGDCAVKLAGATPAANIIWYPDNGQQTVQPDTLMVFEWIAKPTTSNGKALLQITTQNVGGGGLASAIITQTLVSLVQNFANGYARYVATYVVPSNKELVNARLAGASGEDVYVDYFNVYGPNQYIANELLYTGAAAGFSNAAFKLAKFRGLNVRKEYSGENDETYNCRKDAGGTYSWNLVV